MSARWALVSASLLAACSGASGPPGTQIRMSFDRADGFYAAPFPSDDLRRADGTVDLSAFPNPDAVQMVQQAIDLLAGVHGFAESGGVFFSLTGPLDPAGLPSLAASITPGSPVFLVGVDPHAPDFLARYPIQVRFAVDGGPFGVPDLLSLLPLQGVPLRPSDTYAAVVLTSLHDASGRPLAQSPAMQDLANGCQPPGLSAAAFAEYESALSALTGKAGLQASGIAGLAVFTTADPTAETRAVVAAMRARPLPAPDMPYMANEVFPDYCVYSSTIPMPDYQSGTPPFQSTGGTWQLDAKGRPIFQRNDESILTVTIPRRTIPAAGFPVVVFVRTGGGGNRPLVDRGTQATNGGPPIVPGSGPAMYFARAGFAGVEVDGPLEGLRNVTGGNEDYLIFNFNNPGALRDNVRESGAELALFAHVVATLSLDAASCPATVSASGSTRVTFDATHIALMGHSMGATIAPLVLATEPLYHTAILSGAGGSWIENIMYKQLPIDILDFARLILGYDSAAEPLTENDPVLTLVQWAIESADPQVYDRYIVDEPPAGFAARDVLMEQGIVDHYILPQIANTTSLSLGLDLAGPALDERTPALASQTPLIAVLPFSGRHQLGYPVTGNVTLPGGGAVTAMVAQHMGDGIEDGHEVVFQTDPPKHQYQCFLSSWLATGTPTVPPDAPADAPCN